MSANDPKRTFAGDRRSRRVYQRACATPTLTGHISSFSSGEYSGSLFLDLKCAIVKVSAVSAPGVRMPIALVFGLYPIASDGVGRQRHNSLISAHTQGAMNKALPDPSENDMKDI